jgi:hypothetical protein
MATTMTKDPIAIGSQQNGVISAIKKTNRLTICEAVAYLSITRQHHANAGVSSRPKSGSPTLDMLFYRSP